MSRTIKAIERHMILPVRLGPRSRIPPCPVADSPRHGEFVHRQTWRARTSVSCLKARRRMAATRTRNTFRTGATKVALGLRASVFCDDRRRGRLGGVMLGTIETVSTHSGSLTKVGSEPAKSIRLIGHDTHDNCLGTHPRALQLYG